MVSRMSQVTSRKATTVGLGPGLLGGGVKRGTRRIGRERKLTQQHTALQRYPSPGRQRAGRDGGNVLGTGGMLLNRVQMIRTKRHERAGAEQA